MGILDPDDLVFAFLNHNKKHPHTTYCISANALPGHDATRLAQLANARYGQMSVSSAARLGNAGYTVRLTRVSDGHCDVFLTDAENQLPNPWQIADLKAAFDTPIPNPARKVGFHP